MGNMFVDPCIRQVSFLSLTFFNYLRFAIHKQWEQKNAMEAR